MNVYSYLFTNIVLGYFKQCNCKHNHATHGQTTSVAHSSLCIVSQPGSAHDSLTRFRVPPPHVALHSLHSIQPKKSVSDVIVHYYQYCSSALPIACILVFSANLIVLFAFFFEDVFFNHFLFIFK